MSYDVRDDYTLTDAQLAGLGVDLPAALGMAQACDLGRCKWGTRRGGDYECQGHRARVHFDTADGPVVLRYGPCPRQPGGAPPAPGMLPRATRTTTDGYRVAVAALMAQRRAPGTLTHDAFVAATYAAARDHGVTLPDAPDEDAPW